MSAFSDMQNDIASLENEVASLRDIIIDYQHILRDIYSLSSLGKTKELADLITTTLNKK